MNNVKNLLYAFLILLFGAIAAFAQDRIKLSGSYLNTEFEANPIENLEYLKGFSIDADAKIYAKHGWRLGGLFNYQRVLDQTVIVNYLDTDAPIFTEIGPLFPIVNIQRDVNTFSFGAQLSKKAGPIEPFGAFLLGVRRLHEDFNYDVVRKYRLGVDVIFHKESNFFIRPFFVEFERGHQVIDYKNTATFFVFTSGTTQKYGAGAGFRF